MSWTRPVSLALALAALSSVAEAVQKPSFSGTWIITAPTKGAGQAQVVKQDEKTLTITSGGRTMVHQLDGVERRQTMAMRGGEIVMLSKSIWDGKTIVITTTTDYPNKMKTVATEVWSIDDQGRLIIDFTEKAEGNPPRILKVIHTRKS